MNDIWIGTSYHDDNIYMNFQELVEKLGEPQYDGTGDYKIQKEWNLVTDDNVPFTVYDWKEYERDVTDGEIVEWHIGYKGMTVVERENNRKSICEYLKSLDIDVITRKLFDF